VQAPAQAQAPAQQAAQAAPGEQLVTLIKTKHDYKTAWGTLFKGEYSPPEWILTLEATSSPVTEISVEGKQFIAAKIAKASDPASDRFVCLFTPDRKKCWALEATVPPGLGADGLAHPKRYAALRYYGSPDLEMKRYLTFILSRDPSWK